MARGDCRESRWQSKRIFREICIFFFSQNILCSDAVLSIERLSGQLWILNPIWAQQQLAENVIFQKIGQQLILSVHSVSRLRLFFSAPNVASDQTGQIFFYQFFRLYLGVASEEVEIVWETSCSLPLTGETLTLGESTIRLFLQNNSFLKDDVLSWSFNHIELWISQPAKDRHFWQQSCPGAKLPPVDKRSQTNKKTKKQKNKKAKKQKKTNKNKQINKRQENKK